MLIRLFNRMIYPTGYVLLPIGQVMETFDKFKAHSEMFNRDMTRLAAMRNTQSGTDEDGLHLLH
jgi:hypothetical protein